MTTSRAVDPIEVASVLLLVLLAFVAVSVLLDRRPAPAPVSCAVLLAHSPTPSDSLFVFVNRADCAPTH